MNTEIKNNTTYDEIFKAFLLHCGVDLETLPTTDEGKYAIIESGAMYYNLKVDQNIIQIQCDNSTETINTKLNNNELLLLSYCMKYVVLENELVAFEQKYQLFQKDIGVKFYGDQIKARRSTISRTDRKIYEILSTLDTHEIM